MRLDVFAGKFEFHVATSIGISAGAHAYINIPTPHLSPHLFKDIRYVFIPFAIGADEHMQFWNFLDGWYAKETFCQFDALKEARAYPVLKYKMSFVISFHA